MVSAELRDVCSTFDTRPVWRDELPAFARSFGAASRESAPGTRKPAAPMDCCGALPPREFTPQIQSDRRLARNGSQPLSPITGRFESMGLSPAGRTG
jgi:hypothetical protein